MKSKRGHGHLTLIQGGQTLPRSEHAVFNASGAERWSQCHRSPRMEKGLPDFTTFESAEGTAAHHFAALSLQTGTFPTDLIGQSVTIDDVTITVDDDMAEAIDEYIYYLASAMQSATDTQLYIEQAVDFSHWVPGGTGTADAIVVSRELDQAWVVDLKYGAGLRVSAINSLQAGLYAVAVPKLIGWTPSAFVLTIVQPRLDHVDQWAVTYPDLVTQAKRLGAEAQKTFADDAAFYPHQDTCRFCKARPTCPALRDLVIELLYPTDEEPMQNDKWKKAAAGIDPSHLDVTDLAIALANQPLVKSWLSAVEKRALQLRLEGAAIPGFKLVHGTRPRQYAPGGIDKIETQFFLKHQDLYKEVAISPAQLELQLKKQGWKDVNLEPFTVKPEGALKLAPDSDRRAEVVLKSAAEEFADFDFLT